MIFKKTVNHTLILILFWAFLPTDGFSSNSAWNKLQNNPFENKQLRVFLDFPFWADENYVRLHIPIVEYVRDTELADVHIIMSRHTAGQAGSNYVIRFIGQGQCSSMKNELKFWAESTKTEQEIRDAYTSMIKIGLASYVANKQNSPENLAVIYNFDTLEQTNGTGSKKDPWNRWVFELYGGAYYNAEQTKESLHVRYGVYADKITKDWKIRARPYFNYNENSFEVDDSTITVKSRRDGFDGYLIRSINDRWSTGVYTDMLSATYYNMNFQIEISPAVQYSLFPYSEAMRRSLSLAYKLDFVYNDYLEETIFGKTEETLLGHSLVLSADFLQTWGRVRAGVVGAQHFHDFKSNRLELFTQTDLRIFKGFALSIQGQFDFINDLVAIPAGDLSTEDILLEQQRRATNFQFYGHLGFTYTFGSELSADYNPRL